MTDGRTQQPGRPAFVVAIGLSAFLLFSLELLAGRMVLPVFGGSPAVWTTALCFFAGMVFLGYGYAHLVATRLSQRAGGIVHLVLAGVTLIATVLGPMDLGALRFANMPAAVNVLLVLAAIAGAPVFLLSTTTPLLSSWFSKRGGDPWWLYAVSNGASLAGLLAYPLVIEPTVPLSGQRVLVIGALVVLAGALAVVVAGGRRECSVDGAEEDAVAEAPEAAEPRPARRRQVLWLLAASVPAGLLSATTTHLATDHTSTPLLWIGPLAIYLASFVVAFSARGRRALPVFDRLVPAAATLMWVLYIARVGWNVLVLVPLLLCSFGVLAVAIHGRLALDRPGAAHLTRFYLLVSAGGLVATAFVALVAPVVFNDVYEYPVLLLAGLVTLALLPAAGAGDAARVPGASLHDAGRRLAPYAAVAVALVAVSAAQSGWRVALFVAVVLFVGAQVIIVGRSAWSLVAGTLVAIVVLTVLYAPSRLTRVRTFFGVTEVRSSLAGTAHSEIHGTTLHGLQFLDARRHEPTSYFVESGPLGDVFRDLRGRTPAGASIGVVGLGVGTVAAYGWPSDAMTYFEIDQAIVDLARDTRYFTYLRDAPNPPGIVLGDGRLSLAATPARSFDLLVLDAFSSDAVPAHMLTREAMRAYVRDMRPHGLIVFQLTNRHFDLGPAVASTAKSIGLAARTREYTPGANETKRLAAQSSRWVVVGRPEDVARLDGAGWTDPPAGPVLTDDFSDVMWLLRSR